MMKKLNVLFLLLLPLLYCYIGILYKSEIGPYHLFVTDPEYAYLLNGLNIRLFSLPYQVNGPGTPLQFFCAFVIGVIHLFRNQESLVADVIKNPDLYLDIINTSLIAVSSISIFIMGYMVYKTSRNGFTGTFFQLMPFASWMTIDISKHIMVENFVVIGILFLVIESNAELVSVNTLMWCIKGIYKGPIFIPYFLVSKREKATFVN